MTECGCESFIQPKDNPYCDDHCRICGHSWAKHIGKCEADLDDEYEEICDICCVGGENLERVLEEENK